MDETSVLQTVEAFTNIIGSILVPVAIFVVGQLLLRQREKTDADERSFREKAEAAERELRERTEAAERERREADAAAQRDADRVATLLQHLASDNPREQLLAIQLIKHLKDTERFPEELLNTMTMTAFSDRPDIAAAARLTIGIGEEIPNEVVLIELLAPLKVNLDRSKEMFDRWRGRDMFLEEIIHDSNLFARELLMSKSHLIPPDLIDDARKLIEHYDAWLEKYESIRPNGVRDPDEPFVFVGVGPDPKPFPRDSAGNFLEHYDKLVRGQTPPS